MKRQSRPRALSKRVEELIVRRSLESEKRRDNLADELTIEIQQTGERAPTHETLIKRISKARNHPPNPLDLPWHSGTLKDYPLPAEFIPALLKEKQLRNDTNLGPGNLTIREAIWFVRLYPAVIQVAQRLFPKDAPQTWHGIASLASREYAYREMTTDISGGKNLDTKDLDYWLFVKEDAEIWKSLRLQVVVALKEKRDVRDMDLESEPKRIQSFTTYQKHLTKQGTDEMLQELDRMRKKADKKATIRDSVRQKIDDYIASFKDLSSEDLERHFGKLLPSHVELVNEFESGILNAQEWAEHHPEEWAELQKLREAQNERTHSQERQR